VNGEVDMEERRIITGRDRAVRNCGFIYLGRKLKIGTRSDIDVYCCSHGFWLSYLPCCINLQPGGAVDVDY